MADSVIRGAPLGSSDRTVRASVVALMVRYAIT